MQKYFQKLKLSVQRIRWLNFALVLSLILNCGIVTTSSATQASDCNDVIFIFARGSGEQPNDVSYQAWVNSISKTLNNTNLKFDFHELGADPDNAEGYPATTIAGLEGALNVIGIALSAGEAFAFGNSVKKGIKELQDYIKQVAIPCAETQFVLGGYSQGAMVMTKALRDARDLDVSKIIYYAAFGDPKTFLPEGDPNASSIYAIPPACRGKKLSSYRAYVPDCWAYEGILHGLDPYHIGALEGRVGLWCNKKDIMCSSGLSLADHTHYVEDGLYDDAAQTIYQKLVATFTNRNFNFSQVIGLHDLLLLVDATESMETTIDKYAEEAVKISDLVYSRNGRVALYFYRDHEDPSENCNFQTCTADLVKNLLQGVRPSGGRDFNESLLYSAYYAMSHLDWRQGATKTIVALTDAGFHKKDYKNITIKEVVEKSLSIDPVNIYVIAPQSVYSEEYQELTSLTGGQFFDIDNASQLQLSTELITSRPVAKLNLSEYYAHSNEKITFDASQSYGTGKKLEYDWDLDGDGKFDEDYINAGPIIETSYKAPFEKYIQVRVRDGKYNSTMSAKVSVQDDFDLAPLATITELTVNNLTATSAEISYSTTGDKVAVGIDDALLGLHYSTSTDNSFIINDINQGITVTLTPYSQLNQRGQSRSVTITHDNNNDNQNHETSEDKDTTKPSPSTPNNSPSTLPDVPLLGGSDVAQIKHPSSLLPPNQMLVSTTPAATPELLPSAPSTGAINTAYLAKLKD